MVTVTEGPKPLFAAKLFRDLSWTYGSLGVLALCGIGANVVIAKVFSAEVLGAFNLAYAVFMVAAQIASLGIDVAVIKVTAEEPDNVPRVAGIVRAGLMLTAISSGFGAAVLFAAARLGQNLDFVPLLRSFLEAIAFALPLLVLNRVLVGVANGQRRMALVAWVQSARYVLLLSAIVVVSVGDVEAKALGWSFLASELPIFFGLVFGPFRPVLFARPTGAGRSWIGRVWRFGTAGLLGLAILEINSRIDILLLGALAGDYVVGIYSLAAVIAEGLAQIFGALRLNLNPVIAGLIERRDVESLRRMIARTAKTVYPISVVSIGALVLAFPIAVDLAINRADFAASWPMMAALSLGYALVAGYLPFSQLLLFAGRPGLYSAQIAVTAATTFGFGLLLIPNLGGVGAAISVTIAQLVGLGAMALLAKRTMNLTLPLPWATPANAKG